MVVPALTAAAQDSPPNVEEQGSIDRTGHAGETVEIEVENDGLLFYPAEFEYYCSVNGHRASGMWGYFIVEQR